MVQSFHLDLGHICLILVALHANGDSSYRDVSAIANLFVSTYHTDPVNICIITDNSSKITTTHGCRIVHVTCKSELLGAVEKNSTQMDENTHLIFSISAHGYSKVVSRRSSYELNGRTEFIRIRGDCVLDIELFQALYGPMKKSVKSLCLVDTCHSGTMLDLEYLSTDGEIFRRSRTPLDQRPDSVCISACNDNEYAGEDISDYAGWGGKLTCQFLDYLSVKPIRILYPLKMYKRIHDVFSRQSSQRTHPIISFNSFL